MQADVPNVLKAIDSMARYRTGRSRRMSQAISMLSEEFEKAPFFKGCDAEFVEKVKDLVSTEMFSPGDYLMKEGEEGFKMYFIRKGLVEILIGPNQTKVATLGDGSIVGEVALLGDSKRMASVRAVDLCDCRTLKKSSFQRLIRMFPRTRLHLERVAKERCDEARRKATTKSTYRRRNSHVSSVVAPLIAEIKARREALEEARRASLPSLVTGDECTRLPSIMLPRAEDAPDIDLISGSPVANALQNSAGESSHDGASLLPAIEGERIVEAISPQKSPIAWGSASEDPCIGTAHSCELSRSAEADADASCISLCSLVQSAMTNADIIDSARSTECTISDMETVESRTSAILRSTVETSRLPSKEFSSCCSTEDSNRNARRSSQETLIVPVPPPRSATAGAKIGGIDVLCKQYLPRTADSNRNNRRSSMETSIVPAPPPKETLHEKLKAFNYQKRSEIGRLKSLRPHRYNTANMMLV